jgi:hypothetical protein
MRRSVISKLKYEHREDDAPKSHRRCKKEVERYPEIHKAPCQATCPRNSNLVSLYEHSPAVLVFTLLNRRNIFFTEYYD